MNRLIRRLAALLALTAFTAYFAESVVAAFCVPAPDSEQVAMDHTGHSGGHAGHGYHGSAPEAPDSDGSHDSHCPLGMAAGGSGCVAASLPARVAVEYVVPAAHEAAYTAQQVGVELLVTRTLYHPPRA
jgi:hypothetical protein